MAGRKAHTDGSGAGRVEPAWSGLTALAPAASISAEQQWLQVRTALARLSEAEPGVLGGEEAAAVSTQELISGAGALLAATSPRMRQPARHVAL